VLRAKSNQFVPVRALVIHCVRTPNLSERAPPAMTSVPNPGVHPLDNPVWAALAGPHAQFAEGGAKARRYPADISPFAAISALDDPEAWAELAEVVGPGHLTVMPAGPSLPEHVPAGWKVEESFEGVQLLATQALRPVPDPEAVVLGAADVPEMIDLVERTNPGPFLTRTHELGTYLGIRRGGALVAMAGERVHPAGYTEISAVCTDPAFRGQGLASRLVLAVAHGITERGEVPLMHAVAWNDNAIRLYRSLGFALRWRPTFFAVRVPGASEPELG
jgi:ribosomal protein S18 acetylase RimI-like enzyme